MLVNVSALRTGHAEKRARQVPPEMREDWFLVSHTACEKLAVLFPPKSLLHRPGGRSLAGP